MRIKGISLLLFFILLVVALLPADEESAVWSRLYTDAVNMEHRYAIMQRIVEKNSRDMIPVMDQALEELILMWENPPPSTERSVYRRLVNLIVEALGKLEADGSAPEVYTVMAARENAFQEALAIQALADMGAGDYADEIVERLRTINLGIVEYSSQEEIETVVGSCAYALERLKQEEGYVPLFFASTAGYSSRTTKKINRALKEMIEDPTEILTSILIEYADPEIKLRALEEAARSRAEPEHILKVAMEALNQGLTITIESNRQALAMSRLRTRSAEVIRDLGIDSPDASALLRIMLTRMFEMTEMLTCLEALGTQKNDVAAKALCDYLQYHNQRPPAIRSRDDYRLVLTTIYAMGNTGNNMVVPYLTEIEFRDWNSEVRKAAKEVLEEFEG